MLGAGFLEVGRDATSSGGEGRGIAELGYPDTEVYYGRKDRDVNILILRYLECFLHASEIYDAEV